ncbi:TonB-linked outer membrane protein, SusC/RagA family [Cyclobacterium xiamenense]|uniref:TonB-linked outer membrane protein, SusC/RagA family n=1 Tax=Cyclobacterium xiamenense TaxID=1297121 RepID=A0A1H6ZHR6_9BACT|nr:TonB-dependent receptor [Cyclobacterium xiamenense]SEJ52246.1 TonB-linked outer membrane protein, SusC/RagA family [Cyclobacterium xiamenense]
MNKTLPIERAMRRCLFAFQLLALLAVCLPLPAVSAANGEAVRDVTIRGTILDETGQPLPGATVTVTGSSAGTVSDIDGNFSLTVPDDATLVVSFIGYATQTIQVGNQTEFTIQMTPDETSLTEVLVVGYGTQEKRDVTGAVSSVKGTAIQNLPVSGAAQALQGRAAGVNVVRNGGAPGNQGSIRIRGTGTLNNADPLIIIDGVPGGNLNDVNPNNIESIEILKDASASAIYGTRAANGVVIVTTKRGDFDQPLKFELNGYTGVSNAIKTIDVLEAPDLALLKRERYTNDGLAINPIWENPAYQTQQTNWQEELLGQGTTQNVDLTLTGGNKNSSFMLSGGYFEEKGMITNSNFRRLSFRLNSDHKINDRFKIGQNLQLVSIDQVSPNTLSAQTGVLWSAIRFHPGLPVQNPDGSYSSSQISGEFGDINNPIFTQENLDNNNTSHKLLGNVQAEYELLEGLKVRANFGLEGAISDGSNFNIIVNDQIRANPRNSLSRSYNEYYSVLAEYFVSYDKVFADLHKVNFVGGYTTQTFNSDGFSASKLDFIDESFDQRFLDVGQTLNSINGGKSYDALASYFGRVAYDYDERYLVTATFRSDGSSKFAPGNRWGYFPAFSLGWRVSEEDFFQNIGFISNLKVTGGWGSLGNQNVPGLQYLALISSGRRYSFGGNQTVGAAQTRIPNLNITWESAQMTNFGLDIGFLENRLLANFNYFIKNTKDMLIAPPTIGSIGTAQIPNQNIGELRNQGLEMELLFRETKGKLFYSVSGNASFIQNEVTQLADGNFIGSRLYGRSSQELSRTYEGFPIASFYGWRADGIYQSNEEIQSDANIANDPRRTAGLIQPGDVRFIDLNNDGLIDETDREVIGNPHPKVVYGLNAELGYGNFDLSLFFLGNAGFDIYNADRMQGIDPTYPFNMYAETINRWTGQGSTNEIPRMTTKRDNLNHRTSDMFLERGDFFRLKNMVLGYTLPEMLTSRIGVTRARFYVTGQNVFILTGYSGMDPELGYTDGNLQLNADFAQYPQARSWTIGTTITF